MKINYLLSYVDSVQVIVDNSGVVGTILMDLSKVFDCLPHELLLAKLHAYGVNIKSLKLLQDYLSSRTQRVKIDPTFSSWLTILQYVPQRSTLDPLFFNIFVKAFNGSLKKLTFAILLTTAPYTAATNQ